MASTGVLSLAVLIDVENVPHTFAPSIFKQVATLGTTSVRRAYADWSSPQSNGWKSYLNEYAIQPMQQFNNVSGKDVADMSLIIDALDLFHTAPPDGFCIVSSDSDFSAAAVYLRQRGMKVFGVGEEKTPASFQRSCDRFLKLAREASSTTKPSPTVAKSCPSSEAIAKPASAAGAVGPEVVPTIAFGQRLDHEHLTILRDAIKANVNKSGWAAVGALGQTLSKYPDFNVRKHASSLTNLLRVCGIAELRETPGKAGQYDVRLAKFVA